jgi:dihydrolipoamide dehydrogenase
MTELICDVAIIGAGTAGLAAERSARAAGAATLLIDDRFAGTTCATVGCMPSKLLIAAGKAAHHVAQAPIFGIMAPPPVVDGPAVLARVRAERDRFIAATLKAVDALPEGVALLARARFTGPTTLALDDGRTVTAKAIVIATGARPVVPKPYAALGDPVLTNETIFDLPDLPRSIAVIGAGPLGLELAQALARLGVVTTVFDEGTTLAGLKDREVETALRAILERDLTFRLGVEIVPRREGEGDRAVLRWRGASEGEQGFDRVLVATGRAPQLGDLGLEASGLTLDDHGTPRFDRATMQCGDAPVFLAGDADADRPVLHEASAEGAIAGYNAAVFPDVARSQRMLPFAISFTDPPVAEVGAPADDESVIGIAPYDDQGRAKVEARADGLVRIYAARPDGRLTGAAMVGPGMDHIAHLLAWAIARGETATALLAQPFYHPTLEEGLQAGLRAICDTVHAPIPPDQDQGALPGA